MMYPKAERYTNVSEALPSILRGILHGDEVGSRLGERTKELLHCHIALEKPYQREVLVPGRKANLAAQIAETMWVLAGRSDVGWLSNYLPRAKDFSDDGEVWRGGYGPRIRGWVRRDYGDTRDQLAWVIDLLRREPATRRAVVQIFDPDVDQEPGKDIPCNDWLHFISRLGKLDLHVAVRSNDVMWGWSGINTFEWSALLEIVAGMTGLEVGELHFSTTSFHLYDRHWNKAESLISAKPVAVLKDSPRFTIPHQAFHMRDLDNLIERWFDCEEALRHGEPCDIASFPEPMLRSWLCVLAWWWQGSERALDELLGTPLYWAALHSPKSPYQKDQEAAKLIEDVVGPTPVDVLNGDAFAAEVAKLHEEKHKAYGPSWKKRGELFSILPNIGRKIDRLGVDGAGDTATDTAIDLLVYLIKYRIWLAEQDIASIPFDLAQHRDGVAKEMLTEDPKYVTHALAFLGNQELEVRAFKDTLERGLTELYEKLLHAAENGSAHRWSVVDSMVLFANTLARRMWADDKNAEPTSAYVNQD